MMPNPFGCQANLFLQPVQTLDDYLEVTKGKASLQQAQYLLGGDHGEAKHQM